MTSSAAMTMTTRLVRHSHVTHRTLPLTLPLRHLHSHCTQPLLHKRLSQRQHLARHFSSSKDDKDDDAFDLFNSEEGESLTAADLQQPSATTHTSSSNATLAASSDATDEFSDVLSPDNPPVLNTAFYRLLVDHNLTIDDIDFGRYPELKPHLESYLKQLQREATQLDVTNDAATGLPYSVEDGLDPKSPSTTADDDVDIPIEEELGYGLDETFKGFHNVGLIRPDKECKFCQSEGDFQYHARVARRQGRTYTPDLDKRSGQPLRDFSDNLLLHYSNVELLYSYLNERGQITTRQQNGNCARHQRKLANEIKRSRYIGLLSYVTKWKVPDEFVAVTYGTTTTSQPSAEDTAEGHRQREEAMQQYQQQLRAANAQGSSFHTQQDATYDVVEDIMDFNADDSEVSDRLVERMQKGEIGVENKQRKGQRARK